MKRLLIVLAALLACSVAYGQIEVPDTVEVGRKLVATVKAKVPEGAQFDGGWSISCTSGTACQAEWVPLADKNSIGIWAPAGEYQITYSGFWLLLKEVTFKDGDGNDVTITSYLGHGVINESAGVTVGTPGPPPPPPIPPGEKYALIVEDVKNRPQGTGDLWQKLRAVYGINKLLIVDKEAEADSLQKYIGQLQASDKLPLLFVLSNTGEVLRKASVSGATTVDMIEELLE